MIRDVSIAKFAQQFSLDTSIGISKKVPENVVDFQNQFPLKLEADSSIC